MGIFDAYRLLDVSSARQYAVEKLQFFDPEEPVDCVEIGDGNINYVFRVRSRQTGRSLILKQADRLLRSSGRPLDPRRSALEAENLRIKGALVPGYVPKLYHYDETMSVIAMEDIAPCRNLRSELLAGHVYGHLADRLSAFLVNSLLPTTDLILDRWEKKRRAAFFTNPELCDITEDLVLTEPYDNYRDRNVITPGNEAFAEEHLYRNPELHADIAWLRDHFMNCPQALLHGDLHTGSIFVDDTGIRVIDMEFGFYGPMGYDIGNVLGNLCLTLENRRFTAPTETDVTDALRETIRKLLDLTWSRLEDLYDAQVTFPLYRTPAFRKQYMSDIRADTFGYAGTEIIRRVVGDSKTADVTSVTDPEVKLPMERELIQLGIWMIRNRHSVRWPEAEEHLLADEWKSTAGNCTV